MGYPQIWENHHHPFGGNMFGLRNRGNPDHKFTYNGKEFQSDFGLNWHDYGARFYDPLLPYFPTIDRFAEKYVAQSPYVYAGNNPVLFVDVNGDSVWTTQKNGVTTIHVTGKFLNFSSRNINIPSLIGRFSEGLDNAVEGIAGLDFDGNPTEYAWDIQFKEASSIDEVGVSDHVIAFVDDVENGDSFFSGEETLGIVDDIGGMVSYVQVGGQSEGGMASVAMHEFGHNLGLKHLKGDRKNIMSYGGDRNRFSSRQMFGQPNLGVGWRVMRLTNTKGRLKLNKK